jgi:hypothetical protein
MQVVKHLFVFLRSTDLFLELRRYPLYFPEPTEFCNWLTAPHEKCPLTLSSSFYFKTKCKLPQVKSSYDRLYRQFILSVKAVFWTLSNVYI